MFFFEILKKNIANIGIKTEIIFFIKGYTPFFNVFNYNLLYNVKKKKSSEANDK